MGGGGLFTRLSGIVRTQVHSTIRFTTRVQTVVPTVLFLQHKNAVDIPMGLYKSNGRFR